MVTASLGFASTFRTFSKYVVTSADFVLKIKHIPVEIAGAYPSGYVSANEAAVSQNWESRRGQTIFIPGGTGGVGHFAVQLALHYGLKVITSGTKADGIKWLKSLGVLVINYRNEDVVKAVMEATNGQGVDLAYDSICQAESFVSSTQVVKKGGSWARLGIAVSNEEAQRKAESRGVKIVIVHSG